jgi:PBSX family phage terminase large subunit
LDLSNLKLNKSQAQVFHAIFNSDGTMKQDCPNEIACFAGFRSGKSFVMMLIVFLLCVQYPRTHFCVIRQTYGELKDSSIIQFLNDFEGTGQFNWRKSDRDALFANGSIISFRAFSDDSSKVKSSNFDGCLMVQAEECDYSLFLQVLGRLSGKNLPKPILLTEGNPSESWCKHRFAERTQEELERESILFVQGTTYDNEANIPKDYIKMLLKQYPQDYIDRYVFGNWNKTSARVYTALADHHKIEPIRIMPNNYRCIAFDHGVTNDSCLLFLAKDEHEKVYVFDEWTKKHASLNDIYQAANKYGRLPIVADTSIKQTTVRGGDEFGSVYGDLAAMGLWLIDAIKKDKTANILLVNSYFHQNKLHIFSHCEYTWGQHKRYQYKHDKKDEVVKKDDHACDSLQYGLRHLHTIKTTGSIDLFAAKPRGPTLRERTERHEPKEIHGGYLT